MNGQVFPSLWDFLIQPLLTLLPLALFLILFQRGLLKSRVANLPQIMVGIGMSAVGLVLFNQGLRQGLVPLGEMAGQGLMEYSGVGLLIAFALVLGYGATIAEPALAAMGIQVEEVTGGAFKKHFLIQAVAVGVALGVMGGILRLVYDFSLMLLVLPALGLLAVLALFTPARYLAIAWDSGGVTTGPVTVPLVLALGLGIAANGGGFGIITLASLGPILAVSLFGVLLSRRTRGRHVGRS